MSLIIYWDGIVRIIYIIQAKITLQQCSKFERTKKVYQKCASNTSTSLSLVKIQISSIEHVRMTLVIAYETQKVFPRATSRLRKALAIHKIAISLRSFISTPSNVLKQVFQYCIWHWARVLHFLFYVQTCSTINFKVMWTK